MNINDLINGALSGTLDLKIELNEKEHVITSEEAIHKMAQDVIDGMYGSGQTRKDNLYNVIQNEVNAIMKGE